MAYISKNGSKWRAAIFRNGIRKSRTFETKAAASLWAASEEAEILAVKRGALPKKTFADALIRYRDEISVRKKGVDFEEKRINAFLREFPKLAARQLAEIDSSHIAEWRDKRLQTVTKGSVQREVNLLSNVFTIARDEWRWCRDSPFRGFRAPGDNPPRVRRIAPGEVKRLLRRLGFRTNHCPATKSQEVALAFLISLRTGMRAGEILALTPARIDAHRRVASVPHKTEHLTGRPREVPLSRHALRLLKIFAHGEQANGAARDYTGACGEPAFHWTVTSASLDALFRKARDSLLIHDLHFHDARAYALTRFARRVDAMTLAKISGHKDLRILLDTYYRITSNEIADMLDLPRRDLAVGASKRFGQI